MKKNKKGSAKIFIKNQIFAMVLVGILLVAVITAAIVTKKVSMYVAATIFTIEYILMLLHEINLIKEAAGHKVKKNPIYMWLFIFILIMTLIGAFTMLVIKDIKIKSNSIETQATIYKIDKKIEYKTEYDEEGNSYENRVEKCDNYITYNIDNKKYYTKLSTTNCKYEPKDKITIYYNKDNPNEIVEEGMIFFKLLGLVIALIGLFAFFYSSFKSKKGTTKRKKQKKAIE